MGWGNEPLKKWYFNFQGKFLNKKKSYIKKLNWIGFSHVWVSNSAILKPFEKFHLVTAALRLPPSSFATCPSNLAKSAGSLFHTDFSKFPSIFANLYFFPSSPTPGRSVPVTRVSYIGRGGWVDLILLRNWSLHTVHGGTPSMEGVLVAAAYRQVAGIFQVQMGISLILGGSKPLPGWFGALLQWKLKLTWAFACVKEGVKACQDALCTYVPSKRWFGKFAQISPGKMCPRVPVWVRGGGCNRYLGNAQIECALTDTGASLRSKLWGPGLLLPNTEVHDKFEYN